MLPHVFVNGYISRQEEYVAGTSYGLTQIGGNINANFGKRFKGLTVTVGMNRLRQSKRVTRGHRARGERELRRNIGRWELEGNFGYQQSVQTLLAIYQTSSLN